jgi:hypothetical protein
VLAAPVNRFLVATGVGGAAGLVALGFTMQVGDPSIVVGVAIMAVLAACIWMFLSERYALTLGLLLLYLGLADGFLKLRTGNPQATLVRDVLLYAIVGGALARFAIAREGIRLPPLSGWPLAWVLVALVAVFNPGSYPFGHALPSLRPHLEFVPLFFFGYLIMRDQRRLRTMLVLLLVVGAANGVVGAIQFNLTPEQMAAWGPGYHNFILGGAEGGHVSGRVFVASDGEDRVRPFGLGSDAGGGGLIAMLALPAAIALIGAAWKRPSRAALALVLSAGVALAIATCQGRGVIVAAFVTVFGYALLSVTSRRLVPTLAGIAMAGLVVTFVISTVSKDSGSASFSRYQTIAPSKLVSATQYNRGTSLALVPAYLKRFPFGHGLGTAGPAAGFGGNTHTGLNGENEFSFLVLEMGIAGLVIMVGFTLRLLMLAITRLRRIADDELRTTLAAVVAPVFGIFALFVGGPATAGSPLSPYLWFAGGVIAYWLVDAVHRLEPPGRSARPA